MNRCDLCPRYCKVDRTRGETGFCGAGTLPEISHLGLHRGEEPPISGFRGSGTVFFTRCNLRCVFCQNHTISQGSKGREVTPRDLAGKFLHLQERGAHNINLVSPTHYSRQVAEAIRAARQRGLGIPVVYNSNGYDSKEALQRLDGLVDVYLPDLKYFSDNLAEKYSSAPRYFVNASRSIKEMSRQVGVPKVDANGIILSGLVVRHLALPGCVEDSLRILRWFESSLPPGTCLSLMSQYYPAHKAREFPQIARRLAREEYERLLDEVSRLGIENAYVQQISSASSKLTPDFSKGNSPKS